MNTLVKPTISCIMPVRLSEYPGCAPNRKQLFVRAVNSFLSCKHPSAELIVASDGCKESIEIIERHYKKELAAGTIKLLKLPRHELFTGSLRQSAIDNAQGEILCNLDSDDVLLPHHLHNLEACFDTNKLAWVYFNYTRKLDILRGVEELVNCDGSLDSLCTGNVAWRRGLDVTWKNCDGRMDNKGFNKQLMEKYPEPHHKKIFGCGYVVKHTSNIVSK